MSTYWGNHWTEVRRKKERLTRWSLSFLLSRSLQISCLLCAHACTTPPYSSLRLILCNGQRDRYPASLINDDWPRRFWLEKLNWLSRAFRPHAEGSVASWKIDTLAFSLDFISSFGESSLHYRRRWRHTCTSSFTSSHHHIEGVAEWVNERERESVSYC